MVENFRKHFPIIFLILAVLLFYAPFLFSLFTQEHKLPFPSDTIVGLYSPFRDFFAQEYPNGIPFKNFLITDPARQTFVWKELVVEGFANFSLPLWNPYEMTGKPLLGNFQSGVFYPLNIIYAFFEFELAWSFLILLQSLLMGVFTYLYLRGLRIIPAASALGAAAFTFSGFTISWLEWGTVVHTALWLPLLLLSIDKYFEFRNKKKIVKKIDASYYWIVLYVFSICSSFFAGHLQIFAYVFLLGAAYFVFRFFQSGKKFNDIFPFLMGNAAFFLISFVQIFAAFQFIISSGRGTDQSYLLSEGWFVPFAHLVQILVPDYFGNPATLNYWGTWNYGELILYVGVMPLLFAFYSLFKKNSTVLFFLGVLIASLLFALPTGISSIPFVLDIPFVSSAQPTRLLFLSTFSLCVMAAHGLNNMCQFQRFSPKALMPLSIILLLFGSVWIIALLGNMQFFENNENIAVAKRNLVFPTIILGISTALVLALLVVRQKIVREMLMIVVLLVLLMELSRFAQKFTPFVSASYVFPQTSITEYLKNDNSIYRVASTDRRIMPPNFFTHYRIQTIEGYDPLYLRNYSEYIVALERGRPDLSEPFGFNRIITPHNYSSQLFDFLNTKYVLSLDEIRTPKLIKVFEEGQTKVYQNRLAFDRAYFVKQVKVSSNSINDLFSSDLKEVAIVSGDVDLPNDFSVGEVDVVKYSSEKVVLRTKNQGAGFLVLSDAYYPTWSVHIDGEKSKIYKTNHAFRGVVVPSGEHTVEFRNSLF